jgi:Fibronectin type III domain
VKILVWTLVAILALNALAAIGFALWDLILRRRGPRTIVGAEALWRIHPGRDLQPAPLRVGPASVFTAGTHGSSRRRLVGISLAAAILCAGTAFASPGARHMVAGALGAVARGFQPEPAQQTGAAAGAADGGSLVGDSGASTTESPRPAGTYPVRSAAGLGGSAAPAPTDPAPVIETGPASPTTVTASSDSSSGVTLAWADVAGETGYRVERSGDGAGGWSVAGTTGPDVTSYTDAGLPSGATFYYRVFASNGAGDSAPSDVASATTSIDPAVPTGVSAVTVSSTQIGVTWGDVAGETGYRVERSADGATGWVAIATTGQDVTSYDDAGLSSGTTFYYRVVATNGGGDSPPSDVVSAATAADGASSEPGA